MTCAVVLPAELGDYEADVHTAGDISEFRFVEQQTEEMEMAILDRFKNCRSVTRHVTSVCRHDYRLQIEITILDIVGDRNRDIFPVETISCTIFRLFTSSV